MRKLKLYIASSLNHKIAKKDGSIDWLNSIPNPDKLDYGYSEFYDSIDTTIMGFKTYKQIIDWGIDFPYPTKQNYVFTKNASRKNTRFVDFVSSNHIQFLHELKQQQGKDIWLIGGSQINSLLLNHNLIDEIRLFIMPIVLTDGIDVFDSVDVDKQLTLTQTKEYSSGVIELIYSTSKI